MDSNIPSIPYNPDMSMAEPTQIPGNSPVMMQNQQTIIDYVLVSKELIDRLRHKLRGDYESTTENGEMEWKHDEKKRIINDIGIHETLIFLDPFLSNEGKSSQLQKNIVYSWYIKAKKEYVNIVFQNTERWNLKPQSWKVLISSVAGVIFAIYNSISEGRLLKMITPNQSETHQFIHTDRPQSFMDKIRR